MAYPVTRKRFGQHFLHDQKIIEKIIDAIAPDPAETLVEIGPGQGAITLPLLERVSELHVIEIDRDLAANLKERSHGNSSLHIHCSDILKFKLESIFDNPVKVVGNLPYNISTPIIFHLLGQQDLINTMTFMLQEEVVDRIITGPGTKTYGRLSVMVQSCCHVEKLFRVYPAAFSPPPKVNSAIIRLVPDKDLSRQINNPMLFATLVREAFSHRRKTIRNSLKSFVHETELVNAKIDPGTRPEQLKVDDFIRLANYCENLNNPD